ALAEDRSSIDKHRLSFDAAGGQSAAPDEIAGIGQWSPTAIPRSQATGHAQPLARWQVEPRPPVCRVPRSSALANHQSSDHSQSRWQVFETARRPERFESNQLSSRNSQVEFLMEATDTAAPPSPLTAHDWSRGHGPLGNRTESSLPNRQRRKAHVRRYPQP